MLRRALTSRRVFQARKMDVEYESSDDEDLEVTVRLKPWIAPNELEIITQTALYDRTLQGSDFVNVVDYAHTMDLTDEAEQALKKFKITLDWFNASWRVARPSPRLIALIWLRGYVDRTLPG